MTGMVKYRCSIKLNIESWSMIAKRLALWNLLSRQAVFSYDVRSREQTFWLPKGLLFTPNVVAVREGTTELGV